MIHIFIPGNPVPRMRMTQNNKWTPQAKKNNAHWIWLKEAIEAKMKDIKLSPPLGLAACYHRDSARAGDRDNLDKMLMDAIEKAGVVKNDALIHCGINEIVHRSKTPGYDFYLWERKVEWDTECKITSVRIAVEFLKNWSEINPRNASVQNAEALQSLSSQLRSLANQLCAKALDMPNTGDITKQPAEERTEKLSPGEMPTGSEETGNSVKQFALF